VEEDLSPYLRWWEEGVVVFLHFVVAALVQVAWVVVGVRRRVADWFLVRQREEEVGEPPNFVAGVLLRMASV
jgi:hypothetical protein